MRGSIVVSLIVLVVAVLAAPALGEDVVSVDIPIDTRLKGDPGELFLVATVPTGPGLDCQSGVEPNNNKSEHEDSDIVFMSGEAGGTIFNVEVPTFVGQDIFFVSEGPTLIFIRLGPDGIFSAGFIASLDCHEHEEETTTTAVPSTTSTTHVDTPTTTSVITTTEPPPVGGVPTGGGACANGGCLSPLATWLWIGGIGASLLLLALATLLVGKEDDDARQGL